MKWWHTYIHTSTHTPFPLIDSARPVGWAERKYYFDGIRAKLNEREKKFHVKTSHSIEILFSLLWLRMILMKLFKFKVPLTYSKNIFKNTLKNFEVIQIQSNFKNLFCYSASLEPLILTICYIIPFLNPSLDLVSLFRFFGTLILRIFYVVLLLWNPLFQGYVTLFRFFGTPDFRTLLHIPLLWNPSL